VLNKSILATSSIEFDFASKLFNLILKAYVFNS
jgi:hypothetical protein